MKPKSKAKRSKKKVGTPFPPSISTNIVVKHKFRFMSTGAFNGSITDSILFGIVGAVSATNVAAYSLAQTIRLISVEIWAPVSAQGALVTVTLNWPATGQNMAIEVSDTTGSTNRMAHIKATPPKLSLDKFSTGGTGNTVFQMNIPTASIIDVTLQWVQYDSLTASTHIVTTVGANVGALSYGYLDSLTDAGAVLKPVGLIPAP